MSNIVRNIFKREVEEISKKIELINRIDKVNIKLKKFNWVFIHPYNQGFEVSFFERLLNDANDEDIEELIFERFAKKFLDLKLTITILEGFYKKRPYMKSFSEQIEESIILCLQKDFAGAITLLIPTIEGTLRNYLVFKKGEAAKKIINMPDLIKAFTYMTEDYVNLQKLYLQKKYAHLIQLNEFLDVNQEKQILNKHKEYFTLWIKQLQDYLSQNLYSNTKNQPILEDNFNRHNIFHGFESSEYNFKNFLRLLNCLNFLSWAIGQIDVDSSVFAEVEEDEVLKKWNNYFKILIVSESMDDIKSNILEIKKVSFKKYIEKPFLKPIAMCEIVITNTLKVNDVFTTKLRKL